MSMISCIVNFKENLNKNVPYCNLLLGQINDAGVPRQSTDTRICEHAALCISQGGDTVSKICEGYQFVIVFSGILWDTDAVRQELDDFGYRFTDGSDAELALFCYIHFGEKSPLKLFGSFSYIIYDSMRRQVFAAADSSASVPLFYASVGNTTVISSHIGGILAHPEARAEISPVGISELLGVPRKISGGIFEGIHMLPPAHILKITTSAAFEKSYAAQSKPCVVPSASPELYAALPHAENVSMIFSGTDADKRLLTLLAENQAKNSRRITVYSVDFSELFKEYCVRWQKIPLDKEAVLYGLEKAVGSCGIPTLSPSDFLLPIIFRHLCSKDEAVFAALTDAGDNCRNYLQLLIKNAAFHPAVARSVVLPEPEHEIILNSSRLIAQSFGISLSTPILGSVSTENSMPAAMKTSLRHILLEIISKDSSPILAFFRRPALLRLCEGNFDLSDAELSEGELISYIIKLNIWLEQYHPTLI